MSSKQTTPKSSAERLIKQAEALKLRAHGNNFRAIAKELKCSISTAHSLVKEAFVAERKGISEAKADLVELELLRCDTYLQSLAAKIQDGDVQAVSAALKVADRRAKLLGLDAPAKLEHSGSVMVIASDIDERL